MVMHNLHEALTWAGFYKDNAFPHVDGFWSTPAGISASFIIWVCAAINVFHPGIDDNWFDRVWYSCVSLLMFCAFIGGIAPNYDPHNLIKTLLLLLTCRFLASVIQRMYRYHKTGRPQKTLGM